MELRVRPVSTVGPVTHLWLSDGADMLCVCRGSFVDFYAVGSKSRASAWQVPTIPTIHGATWSPGPADTCGILFGHKSVVFVPTFPQALEDVVGASARGIVAGAEPWPRMPDLVWAARYLRAESEEDSGSYGLLALGLAHNSIVVKDWRCGEERLRVQCDVVSIVYSLALHGTCTETLRVAAGLPFSEVVVWKGKAGVGAVLRGHEGAVGRVRWSPDGRLLASCSDDRSVRLWRAGDVLDGARDASGVNVFTSFGHGGRVWDAAWVGNARIATCGEDRTVRLWDASDGRCEAVFTGHAGVQIWRVTVSSDGRTVYSGGGDGSVKAWGVEQAVGAVGNRNLGFLREPLPLSDSMAEGAVAAGPSAHGNECSKSKKRKRQPKKAFSISKVRVAANGSFAAALVHRVGIFAAGGGGAPGWRRLGADLDGFGSNCHAFALSDDGCYLAAAAADAKVRVLSLREEGDVLVGTVRCASKVMDLWFQPGILPGEGRGGCNAHPPVVVSQLDRVVCVLSHGTAQPSVYLRIPGDRRIVTCSAVDTVRNACYFSSTRGGLYAFSLDALAAAAGPRDPALPAAWTASHGGRHVAALKLLRSSGRVLSVGHDGHVLEHCWRDSRLVRTADVACGAVHAPNALCLSDEDVQSVASSVDGVAVLGFQGSRFVAWDIVANRCLANVEAAGFRRPHAIKVRRSAGGGAWQYLFAHEDRSSPLRETCCLEARGSWQQDAAALACDYGVGFHGRAAAGVCAWTDSSGMITVMSASEDGSLRLHSVSVARSERDATGGALCTSAAQIRERAVLPSSGLPMRCAACCPLGGDVAFFAGGSQLALRVGWVDSEARVEDCFASQMRTGTEQDHRILAIDASPTASGDCAVATGDSEGYLTVVRLSHAALRRREQLRPSSIRQDHGLPILSVAVREVCAGRLLALCGSTSGSLDIYDVSTMQEFRKIGHLKVHDMGTNAADVDVVDVTGESATLVCVTGGDDQSLTASTLRFEVREARLELVEECSVRVPCASASAVKAVRIWRRGSQGERIVFASGYDQRLDVWSLTTAHGSKAPLRWLGGSRVDVADVGDLAIAPIGPDAVLVAAIGAGMSLFSVDV